MENSAQSSKSIYFFAFVGWGALLALAVYGYFVYGPQQFNHGVLSTVDNLAQTPEVLLPEGDFIDLPGQPEINSVIGNITDIQVEAVSISVSNTAYGNYNDQVFMLTSETEYLRNIITGADPESGVQRGVLTEQTITHDDLTLGQQVELFYEFNDSGEFIVTKVIVQ